MVAQLLRILRESIKAVPAMKYALAVAGILAVVAMAGAFKVSPQTAVLGSVVTLVLMVAMVVFARLTTTAPRHFLRPVQFMLWAFIGVTVATAVLLFTSAFFHWPRGLNELMDPKAAKPVSTHTSDAKPVPRSAIQAAQLQRQNGEYAGAWSAINRVVAEHPDSKDARDEQLQVAMIWIRNLSVREPETVSNVLRPLTECLHLHLPNATGALAADINAHLGWANFWRRSKEGHQGLKVEEYFAEAVKHDATNPFAHAMWGHVLADRRRPLTEIKPHFDLALQSGRERAFVQHFQTAGLYRAENLESTLELLRVVNEMRRAGEALDSSIRQRAPSRIYSQFGRSDEAALLATLPPGDHLLTFYWLVDPRRIEESAELGYFRARLIEATGDFPAAATLYRALLAQDISMLLRPRVESSFARCEQQLATQTRRSETPALPGR